MRPPSRVPGAAILFGGLGVAAAVVPIACGDDADPNANGTASTTGSGGAGGEELGEGASAGAGATSGGGEGGTGAFVVEVHTELDGDGVLMLRTNLPRAIEDCRRIPDIRCADLDDDGLTDGWEDIALDRLRPFIRFDDAESLVGDARFATGIAGRVAPVGDLVHVYLMLGYERDFGSCGFTAHNGDSERVVLALEPIDSGDGDVKVVKAYTAAHEGTASDHGMSFEGEGLGELEHADDPSYGEPRWVVYASADKHATYATVAICEGVSVIPCLAEDCGAEDAPDPAAFELLMDYANAGEPGTPLLGDLTALGFPGDDAWAEQDFCGGLGGSGCSASVRSKLVTDPF